ncbi:MAG: tRNA (guanosine(37)-N1)-methyltransferase TrmD [Proteobacteria bacterium]|nr:tRNA (guanosine(37)-N1)-methyltransferase TrmD [Pseudomonadota bacterium]
MGASILGRAKDKGIFNYSVYQLRDFSQDKYRSVDDVAYGGGGGMVLKVDCLVSALEHIQSQIGSEKSRVIYFSPAGRTLNQNTLDNYLTASSEAHLILVCGHYEGADQRFIDSWVDDEISLGDFVLTGGELPALAFADSLCRHLDGTLKEKESHQNESFSLSLKGKRLLEYPHYTRPAEFRGHKVPEVLLSGDHQKISEWRLKEALNRTQTRRPDLLD